MVGTYEGDLSEWISALALKPVRPLDTVFSNKGSPERMALIQSGQFLADPRSDAELDLVKLAEQISSADAQEISDALSSGDPSRALHARDSLIAKLKSRVGDVTPEKLVAMKAQLMRIRAMRASCLCTITANVHPLFLIEKARRGDQRAVLDLIKIDKLFLFDSCTRDVIRTALLRADHAFVKQMGSVLSSKIKINGKRNCRLYLYMLFASSAEIPMLASLQLRIDPNGTEFRTFGAFERFFERCYKTFTEMRASPETGSEES